MQNVAEIERSNASIEQAFKYTNNEHEPPTFYYTDEVELDLPLQKEIQFERLKAVKMDLDSYDY